MVVTMKEQKQLLSIGFIFSVIILLINDFILKRNFPGIITGKLSDFSGLFAFPFFFCVLLPNKKKWIYAITAIAFILWKLPITDNFISFWNKYIPFSIGRVVDYTDYFALLILPISYFYMPKIVLLNSYPKKKAAMFAITFLAIFSFLATAGTHGKIKGYELNYTKYDVNQAVQKFYVKYPERVIPNQFRKLGTPHIFGSKQDDKINRLNADSVSFDFFFEKENMIIWMFITGAEENWNKKPCEIQFVGLIIIKDGNWKYKDDLSMEEKQKATNFFENEILIKLERILKNPD